VHAGVDLGERKDRVRRLGRGRQGEGCEHEEDGAPVQAC
jgi:hypothetical protein